MHMPEVAGWPGRVMQQRQGAVPPPPPCPLCCRPRRHREACPHHAHAQGPHLQGHGRHCSADGGLGGGVDSPQGGPGVEGHTRAGDHDGPPLPRRHLPEQQGSRVRVTEGLRAPATASCKEVTHGAGRACPGGAKGSRGVGSGGGHGCWGAWAGADCSRQSRSAQPTRRCAKWAASARVLVALVCMLATMASSGLQGRGELDEGIAGSSDCLRTLNPGAHGWAIVVPGDTTHWAANKPRGST